jgi:hypothetical protein
VNYAASHPFRSSDHLHSNRLGTRGRHARQSYAGQQTRAIKALSSEDIAALRNGEGMGMAKAAELNGYPGPAHVLALAAQLGLTEN